MANKHEYFEFIKDGHGARKTVPVNTVDITFPQLLTLFREFAAGCGYRECVLSKLEYENTDQFQQYID